ncbi:MAG: signal peptidase I [Candidatus Binataceae bacterium]
MAEPVRKLPSNKTSSASQPEPQKSAGREYGEAFIIAVVLALVLRTFFIQAYKIPSGSMEPTLLIGDHIIVNKLIYGLRLPDSWFGFTPFENEIPYGKYLFQLEPIHRGDVVVFVFPPDPTKDFIKRVIGIPGDTVQVKAGTLFINGVRVPDPHAHFEISAQERLPGSVRDYFGPVTVPAGKYFMMGDNRDRSYDSRFWGFVPRDNVEGRAMFIYWSWNLDSPTLLDTVRWERFFKVIR